MGHLSSVTKVSTNEVNRWLSLLQARDMWLCSTIAEVEGRSAASAAIGLAAAVAAGSGDASAAAVLSAVDGRYQRLMDVLEKERTGWFEIATQFRAIFAVPLGGESSDTSGPDTGSDAGLGAAQGILGAWLGGRIDALIARLRLDLPRLGDGARLRSALEQCMFFGAGMGRIGQLFYMQNLLKHCRAPNLELAPRHLPSSPARAPATHSRTTPPPPPSPPTLSSRSLVLRRRLSRPFAARFYRSCDGDGRGACALAEACARARGQARGVGGSVGWRSRAQRARYGEAPTHLRS